MKNKNSIMLSDSYTVLIVDDNMNNIQVLANMLTNNGFNVEFATNGLSALNWIEEENFDLVLLDVMMPQMDGFEVCERIRKMDKFKELPIIFITAKTDKESTVKGFQKGGNDYLTKPFDQNELLARVNTHLELKRNRDKLTEMNHWLEKMVAERTNELNTALQEVTELNKKLLELNDVKSEFLKIISHEIRTPLNGIIGFTDIIKNSNEAEPLMEFIDLLEQSARRLEKFSLNALLLTSLRLGNYYVDMADTNLKAILDASVSKSVEKRVEKSLLVNVNCPPELMIKADKELLLGAVSIVIDNAIRYSPENSVITINAIRNSVHTEISIIDNGPGFNAKALRNLFDFFSSGEQHLDLNLGLGLALANQVLLAFNGEIKVKNNIEGGAIVTLIIPSVKNQNS